MTWSRRGLMLLAWGLVATCVSAFDRRELYPFGQQHRDTRMDVGDDVSSDEIQLQTPITFYDQEYYSIFVNLNGILTFEADFPVYQSELTIPFGNKAIIPFFADVDTRLSGNVYYRETGDRTLLQKAAEQIQQNFAGQEDFVPTNLFIATWDGVGHYDEKYDQTNTYQVVIASDGRESFAAFLYPDNGIQWIRSDGKDAPSEDTPGQAGFDAGDSQRYYTLPGSGSPEVEHLSRRSNVGAAGLWVFRIGDLQGENIHSPDDEDYNTEAGDVADTQHSVSRNGNGNGESCARGGEQKCHANAHCIDYPSAGGYCCECTPPLIGNGRECIRTDEAQRISGKLTGRVNGVHIDDVDFHSYALTIDGRTYTAISRIPATIGFAAQSLYATSNVLGFLFALPQQPGLRNGFSVTGGQLNRTAVLQFSPGSETVTIRQYFTGQDAQGHMRMSTNIEGRVPDLGIEAKVEIGDYQQEYRRISPGTFKSFSSHNFRVGTTQYRFTLDQTINYDECRYRPLTGVDVIRVGVARNFVVYATSESILRFSQTNRIVAAAEGSDPCREARCDQNAECVPQRDSYQCICKSGFEGTGQRCRDVDECNQLPGACDENAECFNTQGSYECRCYPGFVGDGRSCRQDGQSCDILRNCDRNARCDFDDNLGSYACHCNPDYVGDGYNCVMRPAQPARDCASQPDLCDRNAQCLYDSSVQRYVCRCGRGWEGNGQTCQRVDCRRDQSVCDSDARCERRGAEYVCVCKPGYQGDGYQCSGLAERLTTSYLIYTQGMYIMQVPFRPTDSNAGSQTLYIPGQTAVGIDVDCVSRYFYWTDVSGKAISRAKLDGTDSDVFLTDLGSPEGVAIDWISKNIYWTDSGRDQINVIRVDRTYRKNLFHDGLVNPRALTLDPIRGLMFWTDWNRDAPKVERSNMDGTERRSLVSDGLGLPNGITIDYDVQQVCWADAGTHKVECVGYDGRGRRIITQSAGYPFGLVFANSNLYWTDWDRQTMPNINKLSAQAPNEDLTLPQGANGRLYDVAVVRVTCPSGTNPCAYNNGGCRFLCLPTSKGGRTCACPDDVDQEECNRIALL